MNKVFGKSIDFVICDAVILEPVAAIELDDRTHALAHRRERDGMKARSNVEISAIHIRPVLCRSRDVGCPLWRGRRRDTDQSNHDAGDDPRNDLRVWLDENRSSAVQRDEQDQV